MLTILLLFASYIEDNPKLTSRALVYSERWCSKEERIWFGNPKHLRWFQEEALSIGAINPNSILMPFLISDDSTLEDIDDAICGAINAIRLEVRIKFN